MYYTIATDHFNLQFSLSKNDCCDFRAQCTSGRL
uniref:Uncharacterized protein n=1 Tax=Anguilla anguilla TaxID=7936 RepID=A0A0E9S9Z9_ANGAN